MRLLLAITLVTAISASSSVATQTVDEQQLIARVKRTPVAALGVESKETLERWLTRVAARAVTWEVNDCGEGGDGRAAPTCVEAGSEAPKLVLSFALVDRQGRPFSPQLFYGSIRLRSGGERAIKRLADLPGLLEQANGSRR